MARNIGNVVASINELVAELGLEKLSAADDPGTAHPAKQDAGKAQIQAATEGARSKENTQDVKEQVTGQSVSEANPADAKKDEAVSSAKNITTATFVGEDPKVEKGYVKNVTDPGTTHPAEATAKTAEELGKAAAAVLDEIKKLSEVTVKSASEAREKIASLIEVKQDAKPEEKAAAVDEHVSEYLKGYTKSAALVGELTADMLDGMAAGIAQQEQEKAAQTKKAEGEEDAPPADDAGGEAGGPPAGGADAGGVSEEAAALAQAAMQIAQELGVTPEEVLDAAEAELAQGGAGAGAGAAVGGPPAGGMEVGAAAKTPETKPAAESPEIVELRKKAAIADQLLAEKAAQEAENKQKTVVKQAVSSALEDWAAKNAEAKK